MHKAILWIVCLLLVSTGAMAAPRASVRDGGQIGSIKEMALPVACKLKRADESLGTLQLDLQSDPENRPDDGPALFTAPTQPHGKTSIFITEINRHADFGPPLQETAHFATAEITAHIKRFLAQPAAPPIVYHQGSAPRQAS